MSAGLSEDDLRAIADGLSFLEPSTVAWFLQGRWGHPLHHDRVCNQWHVTYFMLCR